MRNGFGSIILKGVVLMKGKLKMKTAAVAMAVYFMVISLVTINAVSPLSCGAEETARSIATISITTPDGSEPKCDYISSPEGCWGASITNNDYIDCTVKYEDPDDADSGFEETARIKIRGNTSAMSAKKPYKLKLDKKHSFGTDVKSKKWVLLNCGTDLKFLFANWVSSYCGSEWQPEFEYVDLIVNGDYRGCYILAEPVDNMAKGDALDFADDGFIVENDAYWWKEEDYFKVDNQYSQLAFTYKYPDLDDIEDPEQKSAVKAAVEGKMSEAVASIVASNNEEYLNKIDTQSFAAWFLANDYYCPSDSGGANMYWYSSGNDGLVKLGPTWDFDSNYGSSISAWSYTHRYGTNFGYYIFLKKSFRKAYRNQYEKARNIYADLQSYINGYISAYGVSLQESWNKDAKRWKKTAGSVEESSRTILDWYEQRSSWIGEQSASWSLDYSKYHLAVEKANEYREEDYENYDDLKAALAVDVYDIAFTQEELDNTTAAILAAAEDLRPRAEQDAAANGVDVSCISGASLTLNGDIGVNFYFSLADSIGEGAYVMVKGPNDTEADKVMLDETVFDSGKNAYKVSCQVYAAQMGEKVSFELFSADGEKQLIYNSDCTNAVYTKEYAVNDYISAVEEAAAGGRLLSLAQAMKNYGSWARKYLIAQKSISAETAEIAEPAEMSDVTAETLSAYAFDKNDCTVDELNMSLRLESETAVRIYYSGDAISGITASCDGRPVSVTTGTKGSLNYVEIPCIPAQELDDTYSVYLGDKGSVRVSALSYAYLILDAYENVPEKTDICNTVRALYKYNRSAEEYFNSIK